MRRQAFEALNQTSPVISATWFHQRSLKRLHSLPRGFGLCAALVEAWWATTRAGIATNGLAALHGVEAMAALIRRQCQSAYPREPSGQNTLQADLEAAFGVGVTERVWWPECKSAPPVLAEHAGGPGLRLLVLRYGSTGHRMAFVVGSEGDVRFFDPNAGEVITASPQQFSKWFELFWTAAGYAARQPDVTMFRFRRREQEGTSVRES